MKEKILTTQRSYGKNMPQLFEQLENAGYEVVRNTTGGILEKEQMKEVWESEAGKLWLVGFRIHTNRMRRFTRRIKRQILELEELACELEGLENKLIAGAQRL